MSKVAIKQPEQLPAPKSETVAFMQMIERAARDPNVDVDKMERLMAMQERVVARQSKTAYMAALSEMKPELPVINRKGRIEVRAKDAQGNRTGVIQQSTGYALWEDIDEAITPILARHGFTLTFRSGVSPEGKITVTGVLGHREGHSEETTITLPHDSTGSKNPVQAVGSSTSYGKRYTATLLLNIRTRGEDDDGTKGGASATLTEAQAEQIQALIVETKSDIDKFLKWAGVESLADLPAGRFLAAKTMLEAKRNRGAK